MRCKSLRIDKYSILDEFHARESKEWSRPESPKKSAHVLDKALEKKEVGGAKACIRCCRIFNRW